MTAALAAEALGDIVFNHQTAVPCPAWSPPSASTINMDESALRGKQRDKEIVLPRQVAMYLLRTETAASLPQIGEVLGGRDHSTILHGYSKIANEINENNQLRRDILAIRELLQPARATRSLLLTPRTAPPLSLSTGPGPVDNRAFSVDNPRHLWITPLSCG